MICVGKIKETYLRELIDHYTKIIRKNYNFEIIELPDEKTPDNASDKEESKIKEIEGQRILDKKWDQWNKESINNITFIIGGSLGLSPKVVSKGKLKLSFSRMTFPHQLMRLILIEQLSYL